MYKQILGTRGAHLLGEHEMVLETFLKSDLFMKISKICNFSAPQMNTTPKEGSFIETLKQRR